jgi:uncharacterized protein
MKRCPIDNAPLVETTKAGVLIDVCPECKGAWLDRGELKKVISATKQPSRARSLQDSSNRPKSAPRSSR